MITSIIPNSTTQISDSPFDSICRYDKKGNEWWSARDLQKMLGYVKWDKFKQVVEIASENLETVVSDTFQEIFPIEVKSTTKPLLDYKLSRLACYHIALSCDSRGNEQVKLAKHYFAVKTREAEVLVPQLSEQLQLAQIQLQIEKEQNLRISKLEAISSMHGSELALAFIGKSDAIVREQVKVTEVINLNTGNTDVFLSAEQTKVEVRRRTGQKVKSLKSFTDVIRKAGRDDLLMAVTRPATSEYIHPDRLDEAIVVVYGKSRQGLIGCAG